MTLLVCVYIRKDCWSFSNVGHGKMQSGRGECTCSVHVRRREEENMCMHVYECVCGMRR